MSSASATKYLIALLLALIGANVWAQAAGEVTHVSGPMFAVKTDGSKRVLSVASKVEPGETLITGEKTYSRVKFTDSGEVTLRPDTQFKIEAYEFKTAEPEKDGVVFGLLKGAMRTISGLIGKRGNQDAYKLQTPTATIGIRGTTVYAELVNLPGSPGGESPPMGNAGFPIRLALLDGAETMTDLGPQLGQLIGLQLAQLAPGLPAPGGPNLQTVVKFEAGHGFVAPRANPSLMIPVATGQTFGVPLTGTPIALPNPPNLNRFQPPQSFPRTSQAPPPPPPQGNTPAAPQQQPQRQGQQGQQQQDQQQSSQGQQGQQQSQSSSSSQGSQGGQQGTQEQGGGSSGGSQPQQQTSAPQQQQEQQQQLTNRSGCNVR